MRALVLSGGGANGAYQSGAVQFLVGDLRLRYDIICGTSVGALNGAALAQFGHGQESQAADFLDRMWTEISGDGSIYRKWAHGLLWHLPVLWHRSVYDTSPLAKLVRQNLSRERLASSGKKFRAIAVAWGAGESSAWTEQDEDVVDGVLASSSFPLFFAPVRARGVEWTDGGVRDITPLGHAIALGATEVDVILCSPKGVSKDVDRRIGKLEQLQRLFEIMLDEIDANDVARARDTTKLCAAGLAPGKRPVQVHMLRPPALLGDSLDFDPEKNARLIDLGYRQAAAIDWDRAL